MTKYQKSSGSPDKSQSVSFNHLFEQLQITSGILNKGKTCYINASLQSFSPMIKLWSNFSLHSDSFSPIILSFAQTMSMLRSIKTALDPSQLCLGYIMLLSSLENVILICSKSRMQVRLCLIYEELCVESPHVRDMLRTTLKNHVPCYNCFEVLNFNIPFASDKSLQRSLKIFLEYEE